MVRIDAYRPSLFLALGDVRGGIILHLLIANLHESPGLLTVATSIGSLNSPLGVLVLLLAGKVGGLLNQFCLRVTRSTRRVATSSDARIECLRIARIRRDVCAARRVDSGRWRGELRRRHSRLRLIRRRAPLHALRWFAGHGHRVGGWG